VRKLRCRESASHRLDGLVSLDLTSWKQIEAWLRLLDRLTTVD
jgi:hypothetical protein